MDYVRLPDNTFYPVEEGVSPKEALDRARQKYPDAFAPPKPTEKPDTGLTGAAKASYQTLKGDIAALAGRAGLMDIAEAEKYQKERQAEAQKVFKPTEEGWTEAPFLKARELLGGSLPYMLAPVAAGGAAAIGGAPTVVGAGLAGLASAAQFTGSNLSRQMEEGKELKDTDLMTAGAAAVPQAALDVVGFRYIPGIQKLFKSVGQPITEQAAKKVLEANTLKTVGQYVAGGAKISGIEGATEAGQQVFERLQAGLNITDEQARKEYFDSFLGGAVLGGFASPFGVAGKRGEARDVVAKAQIKRDEEAAAAEEARKASPEYRAELEAQRNDIQSRISDLQSVLKDKRLDKEAIDAGKTELKDLQTQLKDVIGELKAPAETTGMTIDEAIAERKAQEEAEVAKNAQAEKLKEDSQGFIKEHQALSSTVDYLQTKLQNAMKEGNLDQVETFGDLLDKKNAELSQLSDLAQRAGINVRTPEAQLKSANTALRKAQKNLSDASEDANLTADKRKELIQAVKDAQAGVDDLSKQVGARKEEAAASAQLAAKQQERLQGPTKWNKKTGKFEVLSDEEIDQPIDMAEYELKANEMTNNRLAGLGAAVTERQRAFGESENYLIEKANEEIAKIRQEGGDPALPYKERTAKLNEEINKRLSYIDSIKRDFAATKKEIESELTSALEARKKEGTAKPDETIPPVNVTLGDIVARDLDKDKLRNVTAKLLDLPTSAGKNGRWDLTDAKEANILLGNVTAKLDEIERDRATAEQYKMGLPADPRTPYLEDLFQKLNAITGGGKEALPKSKVESRRNLRYQQDKIPAAQKLFKPDLPVGEYTPAHIAKVRKELEEINRVLDADANYEVAKKKEIAKLKSRAARAKKTAAKKDVSDADKKAANDLVKQIDKDIGRVKNTPRLSAGVKQRYERRKARLENEILDATLPVRAKGKAPKYLRIESDIETLENQLKETTAPSQIKRLQNRIANAHTKLAKVKKTSRLPEGGAKGERVVGAAKEGSALTEIQDAIDQLRKGEFFGGAADTETNLEGQSRPLLLRGIRNDVDTLIMAAISDINIGRRSWGDADMSETEQKEFATAIEQLLLGKAARATGWRAELQRAPETANETAISQAFKEAGFDFGNKTAYEQYIEAIGKAGLKEEDIVENYGEANKQIEGIRNNLDTLIDKKNDLEDKLKGATDRSVVDTYTKQINRLVASIKEANKEYDAAKAEFVRGEKEGKGEIRTGMREQERVDIKDAIAKIKESFGSERAKHIEPREVTAETMPEIDGEPKELAKLRKIANDFLDSTNGILRGLGEALRIFTPVEVRKSKAILDDFNSQKQTALDFMRDITAGKEDRNSFFSKVIAATKKEKEATEADTEATAAIKEEKTKGDKLINDSLRRKADKLRKQADELRAEVNSDINKAVEQVKETIATADAAANKRLGADFKQFFDQLKANNSDYLEASRAYQEARDAYYTKKRAEAGAARVAQEGTDRERAAKAIKKGEQEGRQKVGLNLPGKKVEAVVTQTVLSNLAFNNMSKKVTAMRKLFNAIAKAEGIEAKADAKEAYANEVIKTRAYAEREGFGLGQGELGDLFIQLAKVETDSPEGRAITNDIKKLRTQAEEDAARLSVVRRSKKEVGPKGSIEREEELKSIQAEQTEESKRAIERRKQKVTEKQRTKMREAVEKELAAANAKEIKKVPEGATAAQRKAINAANDKIRIARQSLQAELDVITGADFDVLRNRGQIKREAADRLYKKSPFESERDNELARIVKKNDLIETKATGAKLKPADEKFLEKNGQELTEAEEKLLKEADALGIGAAGYLKQKDTARKIQVAATAVTLQKTKREEAEDTHKKNLAKAAAAKAQNFDFKTKRAFQNAKEDVKEKILSDEFTKAVKELDAVREGYEAVGLTEAEFKKYVTKAEEQKLNAWENEFEDAKIDFDDFKGLQEGMRGDWDPRIEEVITGPGVSSSVVQRAVDKLKLPKGLKVLIIEKLTPTLRGAIAEGGYTAEQIDGVRGGVLPDGTVFVVANSHADLKDVERTLAHEITGHLGVEGVLGQAGMDALAKKVIAQNGSVAKLADKLGVGEQALGAYMAAKQAGKSEEFAQAKALREVIAHTAEARPDKTFLGKANEFIKALVGAFRAALRKMGIDLDISTSDIYKLLRDARKSEKIGPGLYTGRDGEIQLNAGKAIYGPGGAAIARGANMMMARQTPLKERLFPANLGLYLKQKLVSASASLEKVLEVKGMKNSLVANQLKYYISQHAQRFTVAGNAMTIGVPKLRKEKGGQGFVLESTPGANLKQLAEALGSIGWGNAEGVRNAYSLYRISKRAKNVGIDKLNFKNPQEMAKMLKEVDALVANNEKLRLGFEKADKVYNQYNRDLMNFLVQTGAIPQRKAVELVKNDDYVPFYRQEDNGDVVLDLGGASRVRIGNLKDQPYLHELVGGDERIVDIYTGALQNTNMLVDMALHNLASRNVAFTLADLGLVDVKGDKKSGIRPGKGPAGDKVIRFSVQPVDEKDDGFRHVIVNTESTGIPSEYLVQGLSGINTSVPSLVKSMGFFSRTLRSWVTRNPVYAARQIIRDPFTATMASGVDTVPVLTSLQAMGKSIGRMRRGEVGTSEIERLGLVSSHVFTGTSEDMQKILLQITGGKSGWESYLAKADALAAQGDAATREVAFNSFRKQGLSELEAALATYETMPFTQRGTSSSLFLLSTMVPFLNAQIQGLNVLYNAFTGKATFQEKLRIKQKLWQRGMLMFGMSMAYAMLMSDDEAYQNANDDERYNNWFVYVPGIDEPVRVPIPFELGIPFKALPEAIVNVMNGDRKASEAVKALSKMMQNAVPLGPTSIPQAVKAPLEVLADYSFYTGRSIVGDRLAGVDPSERFNANTSELAKFIGKGTGQIPVLGEYLSPVQLEYMVRGYTGSLPLALASMANPLMGGGAGERPTARASEMPIVGSVFQPKDASGLINRAYKDMQAIERAGQTYKKLEEEGRDAEADAYAERFADELSLAPLAGSFKKQMGQLAKEEREIKSDPNLSGPEKRRQLDEIRQERIALAKDLLSERE